MFNKMVLVFLIIIALHSHAQTEFKPVADSLGIPSNIDGSCRLTRHQVVEALIQNLPQQEDPSLMPDMHCLAMAKTIRHDFKFKYLLPLVSELYQTDKVGPERIDGKLRFAGLIPVKYRYTIDHDLKNGFVVTVKIYVKKWTVNKHSPLRKISSDTRENFLKHQLDLNLQQVSQFWSDNQDHIQFNFVRTENKIESDYQIRMIQDKKNSLFNRTWGWSVDENLKDSDEQIFSRTASNVFLFAHEVGHMMGLEDEYSIPQGILNYVEHPIEHLLHPDRVEIFGAIDTYHSDRRAVACDQDSIMCQRWLMLKHQNYHDYLILRRYLKD